MKKILDFALVIYLIVWCSSVIIFDDYQLINIIFLTISIASLMLVLLFKSRKRETNLSDEKIG